MLKKYYKIFPYLILALVVTTTYFIVEGYVTIKMMNLFDLALNGEMQILKQKAPQLLIFVTCLLPLEILVALTNNYYKKKANIKIKNYYIKSVFGKNIAEFQKENNAKYLSAVTNDFNTLENNLINGVYEICKGLVNIIVILWMLSTLDFRIIILASIIIIVNFSISKVTSRPLKKAYKERSDMFDRYTFYIKEILAAFHIIKNYNLQEKVTEDYNHKSEEIQQKGFIIEKLITYVYSIENFFTNGSLYGIICGIGYLAVLGLVTPGGILLVSESIQRLTLPLHALNENLPKLFTSNDLIHKLEKTLDNENTYVEVNDLPEFRHEIEFQNVEFNYDNEEQPILFDINLKVKKNEKYLIVGPSGGGKSTLLKLLRKYYQPNNGKILIDGHNLRDVKRDEYFKLIANIEQQVFIFEDTIRNNITLYKKYTESEINEALEASGLSEFVTNLPNGLNTTIYDNGKNISGGEKSRIVIARALLNKASILIMDEAFASLDMERAKEIERTILDLEDMTVINASHVIFKDTKELYDGIIKIKRTIY